MISTHADGQAEPQTIAPLKSGDKVLFIGNSFTEWSGPLPAAIQSLIKVSGSDLDVTFASKVKGMGILKEYATWDSIGAMAAIREGGWTYVVIQGWSDAIDRKDSETNEDGTRNPDYLGYPENQQIMLRYFKLLDAEVKKVGAKTILYEPHVGSHLWDAHMTKSAETYSILKNEVSCFHAPVIKAWDTVIKRHPGDAASLLFAPDGGHQNPDGMALDAMTFYTIFTGMSPATLKPEFPATMLRPELYEEFAEIAYRTGKEILTANNSAIADTQNPTAPADLAVSNKLSESFTLTWSPSTDDVGVLGYKVYKNDVQIGTTSRPQFAVGDLTPETAYTMKIVAFDSEAKVSPETTITVTTEKFTAVDNSGALYDWDFTGVNGESKWAAATILPGMSGSPPAGVVSIHLPLITRVGFNNNALVARNSAATTLEEAIAQGLYFSITIAPLKGNVYSVTDLDVTFISEGPHNFTLMSEKLGFKADQAIGTYPETEPVQTIAITGHDQLTSSTEFRIYVWGSNNQWTAFGLSRLSISGAVKSESAASFPSGLAAANLSETGFDLGWKPAKDAVEYEVFKDGKSIGKTTSLAMPVRDVKINSTYTLTVKAINKAKQLSEASSPLSVTIPDLSKPSVPKDLTASGLGADSFILHWKTSTDNVGVVLYEVSKNDQDGGTTAALQMPEPYLSPDTVYTMKVRAKDAAGNFSDWSAPLEVKTLPAVKQKP
ncbi:MAG: fibronectin type III domain-containing protein [Verrucomicrobia bacterium]|nr:fibronectin type III domain-containing protein [Verrucomicrobiota bacterium]